MIRCHCSMEWIDRGVFHLMEDMHCARLLPGAGGIGGNHGNGRLKKK